MYIYIYICFINYKKQLYNNRQRVEILFLPYYHEVNNCIMPKKL